MKILAYVHGYPPVHNAGAEWMLHAMLKYLVEQGHECTVFSIRNRTAENFQGVEIVGRVSSAKLALLVRRADVVITHLDRTPSAVNMASTYKKPIVHVVHNDQQLRFNGVTLRTCDLAIMNSQWLSDHLRWPGDSMIVNPPVDYREWAMPKNSPRDRVTLINLNEAKGGELFWELAERMPTHHFLGVRGAYGKQIIGDDLPNVEIIDNTPEMLADVYARTRVLLVPSSYESWGRVAIEAASCGIPVIAHPTPGLRESLGSAGMFADRNEVIDWMSALGSLDNPKNYEKMSRAMLERAKSLDPIPQLKAMEKRLVALAGSSVSRMRKCPICGEAHASCGGPTTDTIRPMDRPRKARRSGPQPKKLYRVGNTVLKLSDFAARDRGLTDADLVNPSTPANTDAPNKARRTRSRGTRSE